MWPLPPELTLWVASFLEPADKAALSEALPEAEWALGDERTGVPYHHVFRIQRWWRRRYFKRGSFRWGLAGAGRFKPYGHRPAVVVWRPRRRPGPTVPLWRVRATKELPVALYQSALGFEKYWRMIEAPFSPYRVWSFGRCTAVTYPGEAKAFIAGGFAAFKRIAKRQFTRHARLNIKVHNAYKRLFLMRVKDELLERSGDSAHYYELLAFTWLARIDAVSSAQLSDDE